MYYMLLFSRTSIWKMLLKGLNLRLLRPLYRSVTAGRVAGVSKFSSSSSLHNGRTN